MNMPVPFHDVKLQAPYYKKTGGQLHRYLIPDFIGRFQQDLQSHLLDTNDALGWQSEDRFSRHDKNLVLRLPMHRTFYLFSCEVVCRRLGMPALDESKITSAGFVIRKRHSGKEYSWMLENDEALGWEESATGLRDPDVHRRMCRNGVLHPRENVPTYTGEKTHPLHKQAAVDENGKRKTILYGFIPLGGTYIRRKDSASPFDSNSLQEFKSAAKKHLPWPYGLRDSGKKAWLTRYARPVEDGKPSREFFELLRLLLNRYHLGEQGINENKELEELARTVYFYHAGAAVEQQLITNFSDESKQYYKQYQKYSLWSWLQANFDNDSNPLIEWLALQEKEIDKAGSINSVTFSNLPDRKGNALTYSLFISPSDAREFRSLLNDRVLSNATALANEMPIPKFRQEKEDLYQIVPFVRAKDDNGKERIYWGGEDVRSELFRVAGPFDPNASRPSAIQMPSLKDLRSGLAKGVGMITPPDTFNLLNALNLKKGASEDVLPEEEPSGIGIQWICSFSLPVITLVAMILLMIMISLLNIIFFWLPWIKICLPFPKIK